MPARLGAPRGYAHHEIERSFRVTEGFDRVWHWLATGDAAAGVPPKLRRADDDPPVGVSDRRLGRDGARSRRRPVQPLRRCVVLREVPGEGCEVRIRVEDAVHPGWARAWTAWQRIALARFERRLRRGIRRPPAVDRGFDRAVDGEEGLR